MRQAVLLLVLAAPAFGKLPEGDPDIVVFFAEPRKYTRAQWLEMARGFTGVKKDDKKAMRELSRQKFHARRGSVGSKFSGFAFDVPQRHALSEWKERLVRWHGEKEPLPKAALQLWYRSSMPKLFDLDPPAPRRVSNYVMVKRIAAESVTDDTVAILFPRRALYFRRPAGMTTAALKEALMQKRPLQALGLVKKPEKSEEQLMDEAIKKASAEARKRFGEFHEAILDERRRRRMETMGLGGRANYGYFRFAVSKSKEKAWELVWLEPDTCGAASIRAQGRDYMLDEIADWQFMEYGPVKGKMHGMFVHEALLDVVERILLEK